jgi:hypothetical protein
LIAKVTEQRLFATLSILANNEPQWALAKLE